MRQSSRFEDITSAFDINTLLQDDQSTEAYKTAADWFELAAKQGNASAQYNLGALYNQGRGVKKDYVVAKCGMNVLLRKMMQTRFIA